MAHGDPARAPVVRGSPRGGHYQLTRLAIALGPRNPIVRAMLRRACRQHGVGLRFTDTVVDIDMGDHLIRISARHFGYAPPLAAKFDHYFSQVEPSSAGSSLVVDYSALRLQKYRASRLEFEINSVPEEESAIDDYFHWYRPGAGDIVFDLGAYCGVSTHFLSRCVGEAGRVYAFEPDATSHALLLRNVERHGLRNVIPLRLAVLEGNDGDGERGRDDHARRRL